MLLNSGVVVQGTTRDEHVVSNSFYGKKLLLIVVDWLLDVRRIVCIEFQMSIILCKPLGSAMQTDDTPIADAHRQETVNRVTSTLLDVDPDRAANDPSLIEEINEAVFCDVVCERYGPVTRDDEDKLQCHIDNLSTLLLTAARHNQSFPPCVSEGK